MIAYIPKASKEILIPEVIGSLSPQVDEIVTMSSTEWYPDEDYRKYSAVAKVRQRIIEKARKTKDPFMVMNDRTRKHLKMDNIARMKEFLENNPDWGGVALPTGTHQRHLEPDHVSQSCVMLRLEVLKDVNYILHGEECDCYPLARSVRLKSRKYGYLEHEGGKLCQIRSK